MRPKLTLTRTALLITLALLAGVLILAIPGAAHADAFQPLQTIPGWLQDALDHLLTALVKTLQDTARAGGVLPQAGRDARREREPARRAAS